MWTQNQCSPVQTSSEQLDVISRSCHVGEKVSCLWSVFIYCSSMHQLICRSFSLCFVNADVLNATKIIQSAYPERRHQSPGLFVPDHERRGKEAESWFYVEIGVALQRTEGLYLSLVKGARRIVSPAFVTCRLLYLGVKKSYARISLKPPASLLQQVMHIEISTVLLFCSQSIITLMWY